MTIEDKVHAFRLHVMRRAQERGNDSAACRESEISRTMYYRWRKRCSMYGFDRLHPRQQQLGLAVPHSWERGPSGCWYWRHTVLATRGCSPSAHGGTSRDGAPVMLRQRHLAS